MLKYRCLVLDHDDTVVQTLKTLSYPFFCLELEQFRPGTTMTISEKVAYLKGLAEGLDLDVEKSKEGKLISVMIGMPVSESRSGVE